MLCRLKRFPVNIKIVISSILLLSIFSACMPNATIYYRPTVAIPSSHEKGNCVPIEKYVHFTIPTKKGAIRVRGYGNTFSTSDGNFIEAQYVIYGNWNEIKYAGDDFSATVTGSDQTLQPTDFYGEVYQFEHTRMFNSGCVFKKPAGKSFEFTFPVLLIDGEEITLPVLHIEKKLWVGLSPFNC